MARQPEGIRRTPEETLSVGAGLLDEGMPFHAHEVFEDAWKASADAERELWRGLAQLAVGITHAARGNRRGAVSLLRRGAVSLAPYETAPPHHVAVSGLVLWSTDAIARVERECPVVLTPPQLVAREAGAFTHRA